ncbi:MAG: 3-hydroxyacyl-ACP dehydratase FabZ [bacterium]
MNENKIQEQERKNPVPVRVMECEDIFKIIPHRYPFLLIDRVEIIEEGKTAIGIKCVTANELFFHGHFPGKPIMPGVLIVEAMAQTSAAMMMTAPWAAGKFAFFAGIKSAKFRRQVLPGHILRLEVEILHGSARGGKVRGTACVDGKLCAEAELTFALADA